MNLKKIKNFDDIDINKDFHGNKLIHLIIIQNNDKLLDLYLKKKLDLNLQDINGNTPYHLLLTQFYNIDKLKKIIDHKVCWNNKNNNNLSVINLILKDNQIFNNLKKYTKFFMKKDILNADLQNYNFLLQNLSNKNILEFINIINFTDGFNNPSIFNYLQNQDFDINTLKKFINKNKKILNIKNNFGDNLLGHYINIFKNHLDNKKHLDNINKFIDLGFKANYQNPITGHQPFKLLLIYVKDKKYLIDYYKKNKINPNIIDNYGNNLGLFTIFLYNKMGFPPDELFNLIIKDSDKDHFNLEKKSINTIFGKNYSGKKSDYSNIKIIDVQPSNTTEFRSRLDDIILYFFVLNEKYQNLHLPKFNNISSKNLDFDFNFLSLPTDLPLNLDMIPFFISFQDENNYFVHPYLNLIIESLSKKYPNEFSMVFLSIQDNDFNLHANVLFYDFKNKEIIRFEPYGDTNVLDYNLDDIIEEELTWNNDFKYIRPKDYYKGSGLQSLSDDNNILFQKPGDFGGFCLAWCLWFVEMKLENKNINNIDLINKSIKKITREHNLVDYIRSYGNKITQKKYDYYKELNIPKNIWSNLTFDNKVNKILFDFITKKL